MNRLYNSKLNLNVKGPNIKRFVYRLNNNNIDLFNIFYISNNEINIKINEFDYEKVIKIKSIYEINILDYYGVVKVKKKILNNKIVILFIFFSFISLYILSNIIFKIEVVTNSTSIKNKIISELKSNGIDLYKFKKNYNELQNIKLNILEKYNKEIEWIEIEVIGTKYIIKCEPRIINTKSEEFELRNIISKKDAVIYSLNISNGQIIKNINSYVKKGDIIVSGYIKMGDKVKDIVSATGIVYGEVWYKTTIIYPYEYYEVIETGKTNSVLIINLFNKQIEVFNFNKYKTKKIKDNVIIKNPVFPIYLSLQHQSETYEIKEKNNKKDIVDKAISYAYKKFYDSLMENSFIKEYKVLNIVYNKESITLNMFYNVIENIGEYETIKDYDLIGS